MEKTELSSSDHLPVTEATTGDENVKLEYAAQHFGFTPITLLNGMFNTVCDMYREALKAFCSTCSDKYPNVMTDEELRNSRHAVSEIIDKDVSEMFDTLEFYLLEGVFSIPENIVLPEDRCQLQRLSQDEHNEMEAKIDDVKKRIIAVKYANAMLDQHLKDSKNLQGSVDKLVEHLSSESSLSQLGGIL
uniref:Protein MIS12 homolog n=1 Tax=Arion vulgaris TaxID=1028688 RepID=A0A0B7AWH9_9EUPU